MREYKIISDLRILLRTKVGTLSTVAAVALAVLATCPASISAEPGVRPDQIPHFLSEKGKHLSALKAVMTVNSIYDGGKSRQDIRGYFLYRRPSDFRFQGLGPAGNSLFELVIRANHFELYVPADGKILKGEKDCFARKFPDVAEIEGLIPILLLQWKEVRFDRVLSRDTEKMVLRLTFQGRIWGATLDAQNLYLKRLVRLDPRGDTDLTAEFGDFKSGDDGWLPRRFEVQSPNAGWKTIVRISKIEINPFIVEKNFQLDPMFSAATENCK